ncbi:hypothetical protein FA15DRAFT_669469 [Coprinopsis marcescibilis]|uniref:TOM core complex subunit Tom6 n=1 Tax=Coprinopsis marcescibilis TaxID=230819 RepID=A0A5C3L8N8_COPMA|nr:hypothetical protein FA15DRAFT_669469 [Coprinopsis marcescibilis]
MARRAAPSAEPAYLPHIPHQGRRLNDPNESAFSRFLRTEIYAPEKLPGNFSILTGAAVFFGGIVALRTWGELMVPA